MDKFGQKWTNLDSAKNIVRIFASRIANEGSFHGTNLIVLT